MRDAHLEGGTPAHHGSPRWGTGRADLKIGEARPVFVEFIEMRCLDDLVAHAGEVAHPLVVGHDEDDVGF